MECRAHSSSGPFKDMIGDHALQYSACKNKRGQFYEKSLAKAFFRVQ